jgi:multisubunit Na+/H+ antiporter MnhG subunit
MNFTFVVSVIGTIAAVLAAYFWLMASLTRMPDNIDTFTGVLQEASRLNTYGAVAAVVAALCAALIFALPLAESAT